MNISELSSPIRLYWDIGPASDAPLSEYRRIAEEIPKAKFLSLQITETNAGISAQTWSILEALKGKALALSLVAPHTALDAETLARLGKLSLKVMFASVAAADGLDETLRIAKLTSGKPAAGVSFAVTRDTFLDLPEVLSFCVAHRIEHLLLPMQRLAGQTPCFVLSAQERSALVKRLDPIPRPLWLKITIHDPFLWRAFYPNVAFPNGGCQAANTMLYISPDLEVYPCPMLPVRIGTVRDTPLVKIAGSEQKKGIRKDILTRPAVCDDCKESLACKGGCRGRAYVMTGSLERPDPACR